MSTFKISHISATEVTGDIRNMSAIHDKMIRLAAKLTERFAGDIYYDMLELKEAASWGQIYDVVLFFRENGVTSRTVQHDMVTWDLVNGRPIQCWQLTGEPMEDMYQVRLRRVTLNEEVVLGYGEILG